VERKNAIKAESIKKYALPFFVIMYTVGIAGHLIPSSLPLMLDLTPYTLLLTGSVLLWSAGNSRSLFIWAGAVYLSTFALEVLGVKTGLIFGNYRYGDVLGFRLFDVPLIIGFNWVLVIWGSAELAERYLKNKHLAAFTAGIIAALFDVLLEPVAIRLGYWGWEGNTVPIYNYFSWFCIAYLSAILYIRYVKEEENYLPVWYLLIQSLFFILLLLFL
jgi:putative membrane protein